MLLKDKVVVITGSTRGIGRAVAEECAKEGAHVVISSRTASAVRKTVDEFKKKGYTVSGVKADVSNFKDLEALLDHAVAMWGDVDVWINNAGVSGGYRRLHDLKTSEIDHVVSTNLHSVLYACRLIIPYFVHRGGGVLINSTGRGGRGEASPYMTVYGATKAGVTSLTKSLAKEYKDSPVSIHAVLPGMVDTDLLKNVKTSRDTEDSIEHLRLVLNAFGVPIDVVARFFVKIASQNPGEKTGKIYSLMKGRRLVRGILLMTWYRINGKVKMD